MSVESEERYDENKYRSEYKRWLLENEVYDFIDWQYENWLAGNLEYDFDKNEYLSRQEREENLLFQKDVWRFNKYVRDPDTEKYFNGTLKETDVPANHSVFWEAYIDNDQEKLSICTNGEFQELQDKYKIYLSKTVYLDYENWKSRYKYETKTIVLENTGAVINNAKLNVYILNKCLVKSKDKTYVFGIDMDNSYISEYYTGKFDSLSYDYDSKNKTFIIKFETDIQYTHAHEEYERLNSALWKDMYERLNAKKGDTVDDYIANISCVYFSVYYLDIEGIEQRDWYIYNLNRDILHIINTYDPNQEAPKYRPLNLEYEAANSAHIAKILGYTNSQFKTVEWFDLENTYIDLAEEKMIKDIEKYFGK